MGDVFKKVLKALFHIVMIISTSDFQKQRNCVCILFSAVQINLQHIIFDILNYYKLEQVTIINYL